VHEQAQQTEVATDGSHARDSVTQQLARVRPIRVVQLIIPLYNEAESIASVTLNALSALTEAGYEVRILLVDDGSTDASARVITNLSSEHPEVSFVSFSRNFGKEAALMAGIEEARAGYDVLAYMDSDGQHGASDLVRLVKTAEQCEVDLVCGVRSDRQYQSLSQRLMSRAFYRVFHVLSDNRIEDGVGDFNVLRPNVVEALRRCKEPHLFMKGLVGWVGFNRALVPLTIHPRKNGVTKSSTLRLIRLAVSAILSFSSWPLRAWSIVGLLSGLLALTYLVYVVANTLLFGREVPGYATTVVLLLGLGGGQLLSIGILGEYIARIYDGSKNRPRYIIARRS
jgi:glycosyltransferase involved in cell wall biosynthesis